MLLQPVVVSGWDRTRSHGRFLHNVAEKPVHVNDLIATMLHCLGLDYTRLTYPHRRLTGVDEAHVIDALLA